MTADSLRRAFSRIKALTPAHFFLTLVFLWAVLWGTALGQDVPLSGLRLAHLSPDAPLVDLVINDELTLRDVAFSSVTGYLLLPAGEHELRVFAHRLPRELEPELGDAAVIEGEAAPPRAARATRTLEPVTLFVTLEPGSYYTLNYVGFYEPPPVEEERGAVSINVEPEDTVFSLVGPRGYNVTLQGDEVLEDLVPGSYTVSAERAGYQSATYEVEVQPNVTATLSATLQRLQEPAEALEQPDLTTELRNPGGSWQKVELQLYRDEFLGWPPVAGNTFVRVVHASSIAPAVTVTSLADTSLADASLAAGPLADDSSGEAGADVVLAPSLSFPNTSEYVTLPAGASTLQVREVGTGDVILEVPGFTLVPGGVYTLYLVADAVDNQLKVITAVDAGMDWRLP